MSQDQQDLLEPQDLKDHQGHQVYNQFAPQDLLDHLEPQVSPDFVDLAVPQDLLDPMV